MRHHKISIEGKSNMLHDKAKHGGKARRADEMT